MIIEKPEPMQVGDRYIYSLTSCDPVSVEVTKPRITDADVDDAVATVVRHLGGDPDEVDDAWVAANADDVSTVEELKSVLREQLEEMSDEYLEREKAQLCLAELTRRLRQSVPRQVVDTYRETLQMQFEADLQQQGLTLDQFFASTHSNQQMIDAAFAEQAQQIAEESAALDAFASERKLTVSDDEFAEMLGISPGDAAELISQTKAAGAYDELRQSALRGKATKVLVSECDCTVHIETEAEAVERINSFRVADADPHGGVDAGAAQGDDPHKGFKLV